MRLKFSGILTLAASALLVVGCGDRVSDTGGNGARQLITEGFGATQLHDGPAKAGGSAMDALRAAAPIETAFGGGFVNAMYGRTSDGTRAWLYYVNGVLATRGADQEKLRAGDTMWWDYRAWTGEDPQAVVGLWPDPFVHGYPQPPTEVMAEAPLDRPLRAAGVRISSGASNWRVRVGADVDLRRRDATWAQAMADPAAAGLTVRITRGQITALNADGTRFVAVPKARAFVAAVLTQDADDSGGVLLAVAGLDAASATAAAERIAREPAVLAHRYAVAFDAAGNPLTAAGQPS